MGVMKEGLRRAIFQPAGARTPHQPPGNNRPLIASTHRMRLRSFSQHLYISLSQKHSICCSAFQSQNFGY